MQGCWPRVPFALDCHHKGEVTLGKVGGVLNSAFATVNETLINGNSWRSFHRADTFDELKGDTIADMDFTEQSTINQSIKLSTYVAHDP